MQSENPFRGFTSDIVLLPLLLIMMNGDHCEDRVINPV